MIDLHCHLLPGIDDGARDRDTALEMARIALGDGIRLTACTPHIYPGLYPNETRGIQAAVAAFRKVLGEADLPLMLTEGADIQADPELLDRLRDGSRPTLHGSRYFLYEPPHHIPPVHAHFMGSLFRCLAGGYVPIITHPERLTWLDEEHLPWFREAVNEGAWLQVTAGALTGRFGKRPRYWGEYLLDAGLVHLLATDAHDPRRRPPQLGEGREAAARRLGAAEARRLVETRPQAILDDRAPEQVSPPPGIDQTSRSDEEETPEGSWFSRLFRR